MEVGGRDRLGAGKDPVFCCLFVCCGEDSIRFMGLIFFAKKD